MQSDPSRSGRARRRLSASEKYELYLSVVTGQATQREAAERWKVDRSTVVHVCRTASPLSLSPVAASQQVDTRSDHHIAARLKAPHDKPDRFIHERVADRVVRGAEPAGLPW